MQEQMWPNWRPLDVVVVRVMEALILRSVPCIQVSSDVINGEAQVKEEVW